jgi:hypothetical protein
MLAWQGLPAPPSRGPKWFPGMRIPGTHFGVQNGLQKCALVGPASAHFWSRFWGQQYAHLQISKHFSQCALSVANPCALAVRCKCAQQKMFSSNANANNWLRGITSRRRWFYVISPPGNVGFTLCYLPETSIPRGFSSRIR